MRPRSRLALVCAVVLAAGAAGITVWIRSTPSPSSAGDACFDPAPEPPPFWMGSVVTCTCGEREMTEEELAEARRDVETRRRRKAALAAKISALEAERNTHREAAIACRREGARCGRSYGWQEPFYCLGRGLSGDRWHGRARVHEVEAENAMEKVRILSEEADRLAMQACCDYLYLDPKR